MRDGYLYVHRRHLSVLICRKFRSMLSDALDATHEALHDKERDDRLTPLLSALTRRTANDEYNARVATKESIRLEDIDELARLHYPPCMRTHHRELRSKHHLQHTGRLHYGLFLKAIGLSLEDALQFWRTEFRRVMDEKKFETHAYNIRLTYGKEGRGKDYSPYGCAKIIAEGACPLAKRDKPPQVECAKAFRESREGVPDTVEINHPNNYYRLSRINKP